MRMDLRPSLLPKLAACPCFEPSPGESEAAARGTRMDEATRALLAGDIRRGDVASTLAEDEAEAVIWMAEWICMVAGDARLVTDKVGCTMERWHPAVTGGEEDCRCPERRMSFDFKSGQLRSYLEQQACYAVAEMELSFADSWTCYCVFGDQREFIKYEFTYDSARKVVEDVLRGLEDPKPAVCDYCGWCARQDDCALRVRMAMAVQGEMAQVATRDRWFHDVVLASPEGVAAFLDGAAVIEDYAKKAKARALELIQANVEVPGYVRQSRKGAESVPPDVVGHYIQQIGFGPVLSAYGDLAAAKFRELWAQKLPGVPFPEDKVKVGAGSSFVKRSSSKKKKS